MHRFNPSHGMGTLAIHTAEGVSALNAHVTPIFETSTFQFPDAATGGQIFAGQQPGYIYSRLTNPNLDQFARKIAVLEGIDLLRAAPERPAEEVVDGMVFASGMSAITSAILARVTAGQTIIAQESLYSATFNFLRDIASQYGIHTVFLSDASPASWEKAFEEHPEAVLAYAESPANPMMTLVDLAAVAEIAHRRAAWLMVDNTFATPFCQRPLHLGADIVCHSTTKYLSGHGMIIGGAVISSHPDWVRSRLTTIFRMLGGCPSPFDSWLGANGLKTFELRMERHCANALEIARFLEGHPAVSQVNYPGLPSHPNHALAARQMTHFGGMLSFELKGGLEAGVEMMNRVQVATLAVSLGNLDTLIEHPASMTHSIVPREERLAIGLTDGLVRLSVGVENLPDLLEDLDQAMRRA